VTCPLRTIDAATRDGHEMHVALVERGILEKEQNILLNPKLQAPYGKQTPLRLAVARCAPVFTEAGGERLVVEENVMRAVNSHASPVLEGWTPAVENMGLTGRNVKRLPEPTRSPEVIR
jgi:hypothetical protein